MTRNEQRAAQAAALAAPEAGAGICRAMFDRLVARPDFAEELAQAAIDCLHAMTPRRYDKESGGMVQDPDYRVRMQTLFGLIEQADGQPVKRVQVQTQNLTAPGGDIESELASSPGARLAMRRMLEAAESRARHPKRPVQVEPASIDVD